MPSAARQADRVGRLARAGLDHVSFRHAVDDVLRATVGYDFGSWATIDPATHLVTSCVTVGDDPFPPGSERRALEIEYLGDEPLTVATYETRRAPVGTIRTEFPDVRDSARYRELLAPAGVVDELNAVFTVDGRCWGGARACRYGEGSRPFDPGDVEQFTAVGEAIGAGLRLAFLRAATGDTVALDDPPGVLTLDARGRVSSCTEHAHSWLDSLGGEAEVPTVVLALAARARRDEESSAVLAGTRGPIAVHAARLNGAADEIAVVLERPRPIQLTPRVMEAYDLTPRESQVTELVLRGETTAAIAHLLDVSSYTVQDHLKAVFGKVGVRTRGELANEIHMRLYLPPERAGATPGPYGSFLGS
jgi:DNA-binding CsgD family transcriptional regulator